MSWSVHTGSGSLLIFTNQTGETVTDVEFRLAGRAVGGMIGSRDWSAKRPEMADGDAVQAPFRSAWGAESDPPRVEVTWTDSDGERLVAVLTDLPI